MTNINWLDYPPNLRRKLAEADPDLAKDLERFEKSQEIPEPMSEEERENNLLRIRAELLERAEKLRNDRGL